VSLVHAQNTTRFPIKFTSEWRVNYVIMEEEDTHRDGDEFYSYYIESDTIINAIQYFKLYKEGVAYYDSFFPFSNVYVGAIRDENNKIFFIEKNKTIEDILYDFNLNTGDTIYSLIEKGMVVKSIELLSDGRKKINIIKANFIHGKCLNISNTYFIEGVGSMGGIFYESPCNHTGFREHYLVCYTENGNIVYQSNLSPVNCDSINSIETTANSNSNITVYPVPASNFLTIKFQDLLQMESMLYVFDITGTFMLSKKILANSNETELDIHNLKKGIYLIRLYNEAACCFQKFIIE
jgi:outer membrane protein assembly factor BamB